MDENQQAAIDSCEKEIVGVLKHVLEIVLHDLYIEKAISDEEKESIQIISGMDAGKVNKLLRILKGKDNGWPKLLDYLLRNGYTLLATNLKTRALEHSKQRTTATVMEPPSQTQSSAVNLTEPLKSEEDCFGRDKEKRKLMKKRQKTIHRQETFYWAFSKPFEDKLTGEIELPPGCDGQYKKKPANFNESKIYPNFTKPKGLALIINNHQFYDPDDNRDGSEVDVRMSVKLWLKLGYHVKLVENVTASQMESELIMFSRYEKHSKRHSAVVVIMTHGGLHKVYGIDGKSVVTKDLLAYINSEYCPNLKNKPKLVIIQACQGDDYDSGALVDKTGTAALWKWLDDKDDLVDGKPQNKVGIWVDFLIVYAAFPGFVSYRTWLIQSLCRVFEKGAAEKDLLHLLTYVNDEVGQKESLTGHKQVSMHQSSLRRLFFLYPDVFDLDSDSDSE